MSPGNLRWLRTFGWTIGLMACRGHAPTQPAEATMNTATVPLVERTVAFHEDPAASGLEMRLYEAETPGGPLSVAARTPATPLTDAETAALLKDQVVREIGAIARPDDIRFTDALPKTRSGKIMRRLLREIATTGKAVGDVTTLEDIAVLQRLSASDTDED